MSKQKLICEGLIVLLVLFLFGCVTGQKEFDVGLQLSAAGKYREAIAYIQEAITKEPKNKKYQAALADVKEKLVQEYVSQSQQTLAAQSPVTISAINKAKSELQNAKEIDPAHSAVTGLSARIQKEESSLLSEVRKLYSQTKQTIDDGEWLKAYFHLQQIQGLFPNYEDTFQLISKVKKEGPQDLYAKGKALFDEENFKGTIGYLRKALSIKSDHGPARELLALAQERDNKGYFVQQAREAVMAQKWDRAVRAYEQALEYDPDDQELQQLIGHVRDKAGQFKLRQARSLMEEGWLLQSLETYLKAAQYVQDPQDFQLNNLRRDIVKRAKYTAEHFKDQSMYGSAWFWYAKIQAIDPSYPNIFYLSREMEDQIRQRVQKSIAVFDFSSPSTSVDAGIIVANNLITYLFNNASGDIKILERENLKSILEEMKLGQIGVVSGTTAKQMGKVYGIDMAIMGSVLLYGVDSSTSDGTKTVRYQVGEKIEDNIEYLNWEAKFKHRKATPDELNNAPPAKVKVPVFTEKDYKVSHHKKVGFAQLSFRIVDVNTGENIQVRTIESKETVEDDTSAGLKDANVKFDPLEIPTNTELLQQMTDKVVSELGREVLRPLQNLETVYFQEGEKHIRRRSALQAAESYVNAIFDEKMKMVQDSPMTQKASDSLFDIFRNYKIEIGTRG